MSFSGISCAVCPVSKVGSIADRMQGISPFWYRLGAVFNAPVRAVSVGSALRAAFGRDCFSWFVALGHALYLPDTRYKGRFSRR